MTRRKDRPPFWASLSLLALTCRKSPERTLVIMVDVTEFVVSAFESEIPVRRSTSVLEVMHLVYGNHAHAILGQTIGLPEAIELAERYAAAWMVSDAAAMAACTCKEIGA
jgi:hypothetical protein